MEALAGDTSIGHATAYCQAVEALAGSQRPDPRRGDPRDRPRAGAAGQPHRRPGRPGRRRRVPADRVLLRAHPRRLPQPDRPPVRQPFRPRPGPAGRRRLRPGRGPRRAVSGAARRRPTATSPAQPICSGTRRRSRPGSRGPGQSSPRPLGALGLVGPAARACGLERDVAARFPRRASTGSPRCRSRPGRPATSSPGPTSAGWRSSGPSRSSSDSCGAARTGPIRAAVGAVAPRSPRCLAGRGLARRDLPRRPDRRRGRFSRYKIVDPSFHNWMGLAMALRDQQISDFPLCNKSFNLSYCGHDL